MTVQSLSEDSLAIGLLCSHVGLPRGSGIRPLSDVEFGQLANVIAHGEVGRPSGLFGRTQEELIHGLCVSAEQAERLHKLLQRSVQFAMELERLQSLGLWFMTRADEDYPKHLRRRLARKSPATFFGMGRREALGTDSVAVVGSRDLTEEAGIVAGRLGELISSAGLTVVSGGSRGADSLAMQGAMERGGTAVGVLSEGLERALRDREARDRVLDGQLTLISPYHPSAGFSAGHAMARNKVIYCLARLGVVVSSAREKGGTWAGATEALRAGWLPLYVRPSAGDTGSAALVEHGAAPLPLDPMSQGDAFVAWLRDGGDSRPPQEELVPSQDLFDDVWERLARLLNDYRTPAQVARSLRLEPVQAASWLNRAFERGWVTRSGSPPAYRLKGMQNGIEQIAFPLH